jgi:Family of unknown function (DUF5317)
MLVQAFQEVLAAKLVAGGSGDPRGSLEDHAADYARMRPAVLIATLTAATLGGLIGLARGGSLARLAQLEVRLPWLAGVAWLIQVALFASPLAPALQPWEIAIYLGTVVLLAVVVFVNRALPGVGLFGLGLVLNAAAIAANGGYMPVSEAAMRAVGDTQGLQRLQSGERSQKAVLMGPDSPLWFLGDVVAVPPPVGKVYSLGDLTAAVGVLLIVVQGMQTRPAYRSEVP